MNGWMYPRVLVGTNLESKRETARGREFEEVNLRSLMIVISHGSIFVHVQKSK